MIGSIFDGVQHTEELHSKEFNMENVISIAIKANTPLLQLDVNGEQRKRYVFDEDDEVTFKEPFYSANGLRGLLRRVAYVNLAKAVYGEDVKNKTDIDSFFTYTSGAGADKKSIEEVDYKIEKIIREKMPLLSLFGAGLSSIAGKVGIDDMRPYSKSGKNYVLLNKDDEAKSTSTTSLFIERQTFVRDDSSKKLGFLKQIVNEQDLAKFNEEYTKAVATSKAVKKESGAKETDVNMGQLIDIEFIKAGTTLISSINPINTDLSKLELACLVHTLNSATTIQIGSAKRLGFGRLSWTIRYEGESLITMERGKISAYYKKDVSSKGKELIEFYEEWLSNLTEKDFLIGEIIKSAKAEAK